MASLLVYVDRARVPHGPTWMLSSSDFPGELDRLDEWSWLFIVTMIDGAACVVAAAHELELEGGEFIGATAQLRDDDVSELIPRLGCSTLAELPAWAARPRILPKGDVELLCYRLGLLADRRPALPPLTKPLGPIAVGDARANALRLAVLADPSNDDERMVYADYLQELDDPRGELIALQLARAREPLLRVTDREQVLLARIAGDCAEPLTKYLEPGFEVDRGFVSSCITNHVAMPAEILRDPAWHTVRELSTENFTLLTSPALERTKRVCLSGHELGELARSPRQLGFTHIVGSLIPSPTRRMEMRGIRMIMIDDWESVMEVGALGALRVLAVDFAQNQFGDRPLLDFLRSPLGEQLEHLELALGDYYFWPVWRSAWNRSQLPVLTFRFDVADREKRVDVRLALTRIGVPRLIVQVAEPLSIDHAARIAECVQPLAEDLRIDVEDVGRPSHVARRQQRLLARLAELSPAVHPNERPTSLAP